MDKYMILALKEAEKSLETDDVPVGAIIVENGKLITKAHNTREKTHKITGHAEINAIEQACEIKKTWHLPDCTLYVTLEPCPMCMEAIKQAQIKTIIYASKQEKIKTKQNTNIKQTISKSCIEKSSKLLKDFFKNKRK